MSKESILSMQVKAKANAAKFGAAIRLITQKTQICDKDSCDGHIVFDDLLPELKLDIREEWPDENIKPECPVEACPARVFNELVKSCSQLFTRSYISTAVDIMKANESWIVYPDTAITCVKPSVAVHTAIVCAARLLRDNVNPVIWMPHHRVSSPNIIVVSESAAQPTIDINLAVSCGLQCIILRQPERRIANQK